MEKSRAAQLGRGESEDSPVEFVVVDSDVSVSDAGLASPEKKPKKKRGLSFKKLRSNAQKLIPRRGKKDASSSQASSETTSTMGDSGVVVDEISASPSPPPTPVASPTPTTESFDMTLKSTESLPAIKEDPIREAALTAGTRSDEDALGEGKDKQQRQKKARKPSRAASFMKKLAGRSKSSKVAPNPAATAAGDGDEVSSGTLETPLSIKRQTPEGAMLSASETELYPGEGGGVDGTSVDPPSPVMVRQLESEPRPLRAKRTDLKITLTRNTQETTFDVDEDEGSENDFSNGKASSGFYVVRSAQLATSTTTTTIGAALLSPREGIEPNRPQSIGDDVRTQQQPLSTVDARLSSLLSGDYIAEINKFSIENISNGGTAGALSAPQPPQPTPRGSLSIREKFFQPPAPLTLPDSPPSSPSSPPSSVAVDEAIDSFMRKAKGANAARSKAGNKSPTVVTPPPPVTEGEDPPGTLPKAASTVRTQEAAKPYQLGNSLKNPNNSGFKSIEPQPQPKVEVNVSEEPEPRPNTDKEEAAKQSKNDQEENPVTTTEPESATIVFDIGTQVRPDRTSTILKPGTSSTTLAVPSISGTYASLGSGTRSLDELAGGGGGGGGTGSASFDDDNSQANNTTSEGSLRRIAYVEQTTFYTPEEEELLTGKPLRSSSSLLSSALLESGDYSELESEDYLEGSKMSPHGDLLLERSGAVDPSANMATGQTEKREHLYKILVIGELGTGKTSFIKRYVHQFFSQNYRATIGVDFALKVLNWDQNTIIRLQLWDIAGQERFGNMTRVYYKEAVGAFIVFDVTRSATFDAVIKWKQDLDSKVQLPDGKPIPCILLANKSDQQKQGIVTTPAKLDEYVKEHGFAGWFETSAKENVNIEEAAKALVNKILMNDKLLNTGEVIDSERFALAGGKADMTQKKSCAC
ncbi:mucin-2 isoform X1 [Anopheles ziemanni]|uniref:mucin-2 isoform X1 n=2 Tax=Anopheles coustani TaxID=139045 RepID=UPI0026584C23|nr:mucin-2 isoform X1 [Anopheles coustani]XP_058177469.1 mucin-2 isoform X1 [Anopheles ziemanni]